MGKEKQSAGRHGEEFWAQESKTNIGYKLMSAQGWEQGQGLGKAGGGRTNFIRAKKKTDSLGLGAKQGEDDSWSAMTGMYNELLQRLSVQGSDHIHENGGVSKVVEAEDTSKTLQDYIVKKRLYGRFRKAKDTCGYSENDMAAILGKKTEPAVPKPDQLGYRAVSAKATVEKETDDGSGVTTTTSKLSIRDYFSKKMSVGGSRFSAAGGAGFTEEFQEQHYNQLHKVADAYHGKMGLGSGRSADPWEDSYRPNFSASSSSSSFSSFTSSSSLPVEDKSKVEAQETVSEEKPKKNKKKREASPPPPEPPVKEKKSKKSSSSAPSSSSPSVSSSSSPSEPSSSKKSKKSKVETVVPPTPIEAEKPKKSKKAKTTEPPVIEEKKVKKDKKNKQEAAVKKCSYCGSLDVPNTCGGCQQTFYCGILCQSSHWATHKLKCKPHS